MKIFTKESLIASLQAIRGMGWVPCSRPGNDGGVGNTLEDLLGLEENNLPIPNAAEWELKAQRLNTTSLTTLFHMEPSPRAFRFVSETLLPNYGWLHKEAGSRYSKNEMSFRQTIHGRSYSDRGFKVVVDWDQRKVLVSFNPMAVGSHNSDWLQSVQARIGQLGELNPQPYWGFDDLFHKAGTKLTNAFFVEAEAKKVDGLNYYHYQKITMLRQFSIERFVYALEKADVLVDFDARTGHNHGTKFRVNRKVLPSLYDDVQEY